MMRWVVWSIALAALIFPLSAKAACTLTSSGETRPTGTIIHNVDHNVLQKCGSDGNWHAMTPVASAPAGPTSCPSVGDTCSDGSIYAGLSPDGNVWMYTTPADAPGTYTWNDGSSNWVDTAMVNCADATPGTASSCQTGEANTVLLVGLSGSGSPAPYQAAEYCDGLTAHGHSDWYLPAQDELDVMYDNKNAGDLNGTFDETGSNPAGWYWSSSENLNNYAQFQRFSDGTQISLFKNLAIAVRCVRK
mgnify:CR=1 FL=1|jgi:hypothetical protein